MSAPKPRFFRNAEALRKWLATNHDRKTELWVGMYKKSSGKPSITWSEVVDQALCFGWIDSTQKTLDEDHTAQRYSPRRPGVAYSQPNRERLRRLVAQGKVLPEIRDSVREMLDEPFHVPPDILRALQANSKAWENFQRYPEPYQRIRIAFVDDARHRPDDFEKRLRHLIARSEQDRQFGYGIESFY